MWLSAANAITPRPARTRALLGIASPATFRLVTGPTSKPTAERRRPPPLTLLCLSGWLAIAFAGVRILTSWYVFIDLPPAHVVGALAALGVTAVALAGYWMLRRWGLWLMVIAALARIVSALLDAIPLRPVDLVSPGVIILLGLFYYRRLH